MRTAQSIRKGGSVWRIWRFGRERYGFGIVRGLRGRPNLLLVVIQTVMSGNVVVVLCRLGVI